MKSRGTYQTPCCLVIEIVNESVLCGSGKPGTNEDIAYDDWNF